MAKVATPSMPDHSGSGPAQRSSPANTKPPVSENLLTLARLVAQDRIHAYALLEHAVTEGAVQVHDKEKAGGGTQDFPINIPNRIMQYWHDERPPEDVQRAILAVQASNPNAACTVLHEQTARDFIAAHFGAAMRSLFDFCFHHTMKSDFARLCHLYVHGGIYVDVDVRCHAPLANILANGRFRCFLLPGL
jgi:mannosyltransferase OCH1-like enzyme